MIDKKTEKILWDFLAYIEEHTDADTWWLDGMLERFLETERGY